MIHIRSIFNRINFTQFDIYSYTTRRHLIMLYIREVQMQYLGNLEKKINRQSSPYQLNCTFNKFYFIDETVRKGCLFNISLSSEEKKSPSFRVKLLVNEWYIYKVKFDFVTKHSRVPVFHTQPKSRVFSAEIENLIIDRSYLKTQLFWIYNISKFNNISISNNIIFPQESLVRSDIMRSYNVSVMKNNFHFRLAFVDIIRSIRVDKN